MEKYQESSEANINEDGFKKLHTLRTALEDLSERKVNNEYASFAHAQWGWLEDLAGEDLEKQKRKALKLLDSEIEYVTKYAEREKSNSLNGVKSKFERLRELLIDGNISDFASKAAELSAYVDGMVAVLESIPEE